MVSCSLTDARYGFCRMPDADSPMLLSCPNCATSYEVDRTALGPAGRSVRCLRCRHVWFASNSIELETVTATADVAASAAGDASSLQPAPQLDAGAAEPTSIEEPAQATVFTEESAVQRPAEELAAVVDAPALVPADNAGAERTLGGDIETMAARRTIRAAKRRRARSLQGLTTAILVLLALITGLIAWRADVVRAMPQMASLYERIGMPVNLRGLIFANVTTTQETQDGAPVLVVTGEIVSVARRAVHVPRLRFSLRNASGQEIYAWTALPSRTALAPSGRLAFRSQLASPPREGHQVLVRFFNRRDIAAGLQ
jgi:predicted Zn finger-like uncharacterized protein